MRLLTIFIFSIFTCLSYSQNTSKNPFEKTASSFYNKAFGKDTLEKEYSFIIQDTPSSLFTMRQSNENFLNIYRIGVNELNKAIPPSYSLITQILFQSIFFMPLTHEEGHRSILTNENIGSVSKPYFNKNLAAYVVGVTDKTLIDLREQNLPVARRVYTGGLESDYMMLLRESSLLNWQEDSYNVLWMEFMLRKLSMVSYLTYGLFEVNLGLKEEHNELERDIAGHDLYGFTRALFNPEMEFKRYVDYDDLLSNEKKFIKRLGFRSLLNLIDPNLFFYKGFTIKNKYHINFNLGYSIAPFGDFIDENIWIKTQSLKAHIYFRQYQNESAWFPAAGTNIHDINIFQNFYSNVSVHAWLQPKDLSFTQKEGQFGGAIELLCKYRFPVNKAGKLKGISINLGAIAKTQGFLPEEVEMRKHFGVNFGTSIWLK